MIGINACTQQTDGSVVIHEDRVDTNLQSYTARVQRNACLDGTSVVTHHGVADGDRIFRVYSQVDDTTAAKVKALYDLGTNVYFSCSQGFFLGAISQMKLTNGSLYIEFTVQEKTSA